MNTSHQKPFGALSRLLALCAICCVLFCTHASAQNTPGGTVISNRATATYSDGGGNNFSTDSNTVTVTVANVSGIAITPDAGTRPSLVAGQTTGTLFTFTVSNTGNISDQVRFLANGQSIQVTGPAAVAAAVIDIDNSGTINAGDTDIFANGADVLSASIVRNASIQVLVRVNVNAGAQNGNTIRVMLGDAATGSPTYDNQVPDNPATPSANEVRTVAASVNGVREARGDITATIENDAQLLLNMSASSAGPLPLGSDITYSLTLSNPGARAAQSSVDANGNGTIEAGESITLGGSTGIFVIAPIPVGTTFKAGQTFPPGTVLYTVSDLSIAPLNAVWTTTAPSDLTQLKRIAFNVGSSLAVNQTAAPVSFQVTINSNHNASQDIVAIADAFALTSLGSSITDQSEDPSLNAGDGNANFTEGNAIGSVDGNGVLIRTTLTLNGSVLLGPFGRPDATNTTNNDDFTNRSVTTGIAGRAPGQTTDATGESIFTNTVQNTGNATDDIRITAPTVPGATFEVAISLDNGASWTVVQPGNNGVTVQDLAPGATATVWVRVRAPLGIAVLAGYDTVIRAESINTTGQTNDTINRLYTGFMRMDKTATVINETPNGNGSDDPGPDDAVPGADIIYDIVYTNISTANPAGNTTNSTLTASNIVITEDGNVGNADPTNPNNWGDTTTHVSAANTRNGNPDGTITGNAPLSTSYVVNPTPLAPGQTGTFTFRRRIK
ncbi:MAG: hypothetical protein WKF74_06420 [Pyrinomonadaceae bacterium]